MDASSVIGDGREAANLISPLPWPGRVSFLSAARAFKEGRDELFFPYGDGGLELRGNVDFFGREILRLTDVAGEIVKLGGLLLQLHELPVALPDGVRCATACSPEETVVRFCLVVNQPTRQKFPP